MRNYRPLPTQRQSDRSQLTENKLKIITMSKKMFNRIWTKFIFSQYKKLPLSSEKKSIIIAEFKHLQIDSLMLDTKIIKYQSKKRGGAMIGKFMRILEFTQIKGLPCVTSELINCKSKEQISFNNYQSIIN